MSEVKQPAQEQTYLETDPYKDEPIVCFFAELAKVKDDHRSLILVTNGFLELLVETIIKARCKNAKRITGDNRSYSYSSKLLIINEIGILSDDAFQTFDWFRKLRNRAAHEPFFSVSSTDLQRFQDIGLEKSDDLYHLCIHIFADFWNKYIDVFGPVFAPAIYGQAR